MKSLALLAVFCSGAPAAGLSVDPSGVLLRAGNPWRAVGVNYYDAFTRTLANPTDLSYDQGFQTLENLGIPFARCSFSGFDSAHMRLYRTDKPRYFQLLDAVIESAHRHGIGLVPSLIWNAAMPAQLAREPLDSLADTASATCRWIQNYAAEIVTRYRDSEAILAWEIGNEIYPFGDLPVTSKYHTPVTTQVVRGLFQSVAGRIRAIDPGRPISSGNQQPTDNQYHRYLYRQDSVAHPTTNIPDTRADFVEVLRLLHPAPINLISSHVYPFYTGNNRFFAGSKTYLDEPSYIRELGKIGQELHLPVFLGEFGVNDLSQNLTGKPLDSAAQANLFGAMLDAAVESGIAMTAMWVFDFAHFNPPGQASITDHPYWTATLANNRAYQLRLVAQANARVGQSLGLPQTAPSTPGLSARPNGRGWRFEGSVLSDIQPLLLLRDAKGRSILASPLHCGKENGNVWQWDGRDSRGAQLAKGLYLAQLSTSGTAIGFRLMLW